MSESNWIPEILYEENADGSNVSTMPGRRPGMVKYISVDIIAMSDVLSSQFAPLI